MVVGGKVNRDEEKDSCISSLSEYLGQRHSVLPILKTRSSAPGK
jgi:hypothetical protein